MNAPRRFYVIATLALLWNLIGDAAYLMQVTMDTDALAKTDPYQAHLFATMPSWAWSAYAIGVWGATLGSIALLFRSRFAVPLFAVSLVAILAQFARVFLATDLLSVRGPSTLAFPAFIIVIAVVLLAYARKMAEKHVLK